MRAGDGYQKNCRRAARSTRRHSQSDGLHHGLAKAAIGLGGQLFDHSPVTRLERQGQRWSVQTAQGSVLAEQVVIASNAYTEGDWTELRRNFSPVITTKWRRSR
ncbi:FAD-dependent oxidoreductase [Pseudomonas sp. ERMR1:02]|uniref:FAD-dependent oxidoreductase n=1 Tax=unclassified Pseudomonas TaxID=196821 RepID=UPI0035307EC5